LIYGLSGSPYLLKLKWIGQRFERAAARNRLNTGLT